MVTAESLSSPTFHQLACEGWKNIFELMTSYRIGSREQVASLQDRIQLLESLMRQSFHQDIVMSDSQPFSSQLTLDSSISVNEPAPNFTSESAGHNIHEVSSSVAPQDLLPGRATDWDGLPSDHNNLLYG